MVKNFDDSLYSKAAKKATFQIRIINVKSVFEGEQVAIEDDVDIKYQPACLEKYIKLRDEVLGAKE